LKAFIISCTLLIAGAAVSRADPPAHYYDSAVGKDGADLRAALHVTIRGQHVLPYSGSPHPNTADILEVLDCDPQNTNYVVGIYSGYLILATNIGSASTNWNREHLWCESYGAGSGSPRTDLHHMRPEQASVNSSRGNNFYDASDPNAPGYKASTNPITGQIWSRTSATWEPPDMTKGEVARSILYMTVRYTGDAANEPNMILTDATNLIVSGSNYMGRYTTLLKWHFAFPVTDKERARNDGVYSYQTNRNPFIDHPEWVATAFIPSLRIIQNETNFSLYWTNDYLPTMVAEETTNLTATWSTIADAPGLTNNNWTLGVSMKPGAHFYRLRLQ
jgi:endonuclease I